MFADDSYVTIRADARKLQQQQQQEQPEESAAATISAAGSSATTLADQDQRKVLKFGFSSKGGTSKVFAELLGETILQATL